jgi:acyl transferase domain-containing protein
VVVTLKQNDSVAIIGIGCLFPKADGPGAYWANICNKVDAITDIPPTHWRPEDYLDRDPKAPDHIYTARGAFLEPVPFPPLEFGITPNALEATDTTQLLGLTGHSTATASASSSGSLALWNWSSRSAPASGIRSGARR